MKEATQMVPVMPAPETEDMDVFVRVVNRAQAEARMRARNAAAFASALRKQKREKAMDVLDFATSAVIWALAAIGTVVVTFALCGL